VALLGELDVATLPVAERVLAEAQVRGARRLVLDLSGVTFLDLSGLRLLFSAHDRWGPALEVVGGREEVTQVVAFSGLLSRLSPDEPHRERAGRFSRGD